MPTGIISNSYATMDTICQHFCVTALERRRMNFVRGDKMKDIEKPVEQLILEYHKKVRDFIESMTLEKIYKIIEDSSVENELPEK